MAPEAQAVSIRDKLDSLGLDVVRTDKDNIIYAGVMIEKAIVIMRQYGSDKDILFLLSKYLTEGKP